MSFVSMWKASAVQQGKRFTLPLKGEALSPKTLVELDDDDVDEDPQAAKAVEATTPSETSSEVLLKRLMILGRADTTNPVTVLPQLR